MIREERAEIHADVVARSCALSLASAQEEVPLCALSRGFDLGVDIERLASLA